LGTFTPSADPATVPVPTSLLPYERVTITGDVDSSGHYTDFLMTGTSPDWGAWGELKYVALTVRGIPTYFYTVSTSDRGGTGIHSISSDTPYWAPNAPTGLVQSNAHYAWYYAVPPRNLLGGPSSGPTVVSPTSYLPGFQNYSVTGTRNANGTYSSFTVTASSPLRGASGIFNYSTRNMGSYSVYSYSIYTRDPFGNWSMTVQSGVPYTNLAYAPDLYALDPVH
jgi:hypothetical protein